MPRPKKAASAGKPVDYSVAFEKFWAQYPRHDGKREAWESWQTAAIEGDPDFLAEVMRGCAWYKTNVAGAEKRFILMASTWINNARWEDCQEEDDGDDGEAEEGLFFFGGKRLR